MRAIGSCLIVVALSLPAAAQTPVATVASLEFHSAFSMNLHHALYAAAWAQRPGAGPGRLTALPPSRLDAAFSAEERSAWAAAVDYYDRALADKNLLSVDMMDIKFALAKEDLADPAIVPALRAVLERAAPVYRRHFWRAHDASNRTWIADAVGRLRTIERDIVASHARLYGIPWFTEPVRVDIVWVGRAYRSVRPTHAVVSPAEGPLTGWTGVEMILHEVSHGLILQTQRELATVLGDRLEDHGVLWHVVQFYNTGLALQAALRDRGVDYSPYLYSTGLFDRAWPRYRQPIEAHWTPYVRGEISRDQAIARLVTAVTSAGR